MPDRRFDGGWRICWRRGRQQSSAERQQHTAASIGQKAEVANAREAPRENVFQETAEELFVSQGHRSPLAATGIVFPEERHVGVGEVDEPMIRDRDTMSVSGQIVQNMFRATEGALGIDHPVLSKEGAKKGMECLVRCQRKAGAVKCKLLPAKGALEAGYELAAKNPAQNSDRQKESRRRSNPLLPVSRQAAARHNAVNVGMPLQGLSPGVQDTQEADLGSEMLGIDRDLEKRFRAGLEEEPEEDLFVLPDHRNQRMRHAENQMVVIHGQQFPLPRRQPLLTDVGLTFRTVTISAGVVGDGLISAVGALIPMAAERRRPAAQNSIEHLHLSPVQELTIATGGAGVGSADDIGNLKLWPSHGCGSRAAQSVLATNPGCGCVRVD